MALCVCVCVCVCVCCVCMRRCMWMCMCMRVCVCEYVSMCREQWGQGMQLKLLVTNPWWVVAKQNTWRSRAHALSLARALSLTPFPPVRFGPHICRLGLCVCMCVCVYYKCIWLFTTYITYIYRLRKLSGLMALVGFVSRLSSVSSVSSWVGRA